MLSEAEVEAEYIVGVQELTSRLCEPIERYVNIESREPITDSHILNWLVAQNEGQPYECGNLQVDLEIDIVRDALKKAYRLGMINVIKEEDNVTAFPIDWEFDPLFIKIYF